MSTSLSREGIETEIRIEYLPPRKRPCLTVAFGGGCVKVASFDSEDDAKLFCHCLRQVVRPKLIKEADECAG